MADEGWAAFTICDIPCVVDPTMPSDKMALVWMERLPDGRKRIARAAMIKNIGRTPDGREG